MEDNSFLGDWNLNKILDLGVQTVNTINDTKKIENQNAQTKQRAYEASITSGLSASAIRSKDMNTKLMIGGAVVAVIAIAFALS